LKRWITSRTVLIGLDQLGDHWNPVSARRSGAVGRDPVNLVSAFEEPVAGHSGLAAESAVRLAGELASVGQTWGTVPTRTVATYALDADRLTDTFGPSLAFPALLDQVDALVGAWLADGGLGQSETAQAGAR
jgi:CRISPR system Cascade subunit CasC